jgi:histidinol dehydrogenase
VALRLDDRAPDFDAAFAALVARARAPEVDLRAQVGAILARVAAEGDAALLDYTAAFDGKRIWQ